MPFCPHCGKSTNQQDKFCTSCGKELNKLTYKVPLQDQKTPFQQAAAKSPEVSSTMFPQPLSGHDIISLRETTSRGSQTETIKLVFPDLMVSKGLIRSDAYTLIVTDRRSIFAKLTNEVEEQAIKKYRSKIEAARGTSGVIKWIAKINNSRAYIEWYSEKTIDSSLNESLGNYAIDNLNIMNVFAKYDGDDDFPTYDIIFTTKDNVIKCKTLHNPSVLTSVYGFRQD
jgi:hypothetical protein